MVSEKLPVFSFVTEMTEVTDNFVNHKGALNPSVYHKIKINNGVH